MGADKTKGSSGDHLLCDEFTYLFRKPRRGEIVIFKTDGIRALKQGSHYVKRLVGLPGDRIAIQPPYVLINGEKLVDPPIFRKIAEAREGYSGFCLPQKGAPSDTGLSWPNELTLGQDEYFVLGDNTGNSFDSRYWGAVPGKNIIGRATKIYWPVERIRTLE